MINCPYCGKLTDPKLDSCPHCGGYVQKKGSGRAPDAKRTAGQTCPNCQALVHDGDIICVGCGTNLLTGQKIAEEKTRVAKEPRNWMPWLALGGVVVVLLAVAGVFAFYAFTRDPVKRAVQLAYAGNLLEAGNTLSRYLDNHDEDGRAHFEYGRIQWKMGRMTDAATAFEKAYATDTGNVDAALLAVVAYGNSAEPTARQRQVGILMDLTERSPDNSQAWYLLALALGAQNDVEGQIKALEKAVGAGVDAVGVRRSLAVALGMRGEIDKAQQELAGVAGAAGSDADTQAAAGFVASLAGEYDVAQEHLEQAIASGSGVQAQAQTRLGLLLLSQGRTSEAAPHLAAAAEQDKRNVLAQFFLAIALEAEGKDFEALTALELVAETKDPLAGEAAVRASSLYLAQGNLDKARDLINKAETAGVTTAAFYTTRGRVYLAAGEPERAAEAFTQARQADPQYPGVYLEAGLMHIRQTEFRQAIEQLEKYLALAATAEAGATTAGAGDRGRTNEVRALVEQLRQAAAAPVKPSYVDAAAGDERSL